MAPLERGVELRRLDWQDLLERTYGCDVRHCIRLAECLFEGQPLCLDHADEYLDRLVALQLNPSLRSKFPPLWEQ